MRGLHDPLLYCALSCFYALPKITMLRLKNSPAFTWACTVEVEFPIQSLVKIKGITPLPSNPHEQLVNVFPPLAVVNKRDEFVLVKKPLDSITSSIYDKSSDMIGVSERVPILVAVLHYT